MNKMYLILPAILSVVSWGCADEPDISGATGDAPASVMEISMPQPLEESFGNPGLTEVITYAVYKSGTSRPVMENMIEGNPGFLMPGGNFLLSLPLDEGGRYDVVIWVSSADAPYTFDADTQSVTVDYSGYRVNDPRMDAYYCVVSGISAGSFRNLRLTRAFAQLNVGIDASSVADATGATVICDAYGIIHLPTGKVTHRQSVTLNCAGFDSVSASYPADGCRYVMMAYLLAPESGVATDCVVDVEYASGDSRSFTSRGSLLQRRSRTNVYSVGASRVSGAVSVTEPLY